MTDPQQPAPASNEIEHGEVMSATDPSAADQGEAVTSPAKVMRIGSMVKALLEEELRTLALPFNHDGSVPTEGEIRVAKAQLVGWLEGLFHGIQATLFAQQLAARQQLEQIRQLPPGMPGAPGTDPNMPDRPGTYL